MTPPKKLFCGRCGKFRLRKNFSFIDPTHIDKGDMQIMKNNKVIQPRASGICISCFPKAQQEGWFSD